VGPRLPLINSREQTCPRKYLACPLVSPVVRRLDRGRPYALEHLVDKHGLSHSQPNTVSSRKRKYSDKAEFLKWPPENGLSFLKQSRLAISTISPRLLSKPTPVGCNIDETECLTYPDSDDTPLDECITEVAESPQLKTTDTCSADDSLFSEFLRSPSRSYISVGKFSGCSSDTAINSVTDEALATPSAEALSGALDRNRGRVENESHSAVKPIRIRLRVNPPPKRPHGTKIVQRLTGPKPSKRS
jgi:hypothetical protein